LYIYKHPGCNLSRVHTQQPIHQASVNGTSYDLPATNPLKHNTEYVWRIVTNEGCSEFSSFTTAPLICTIGDIETTTTCNDNCTPNNPADDTFMITVSATVENGSGFYTVSDGATTSEPIASGDSTTFGPYPTNVTADIQLTFTDSLDSTCTANASVPPASPCSVSLQATVSSSISIDNHDAYEAMDGTMNLINTTIQLGEQINAGGFIFNSGIPQGARILDAKVQFKAGATSAEATTLTISAEKNSSSRDFSMLLNDISNRPMVSERVQWQVIPWNLGERGAAQQTPDISTVIQEIVNRNSFSGNIGIFITGTGNRVVQTHESGTGQAATLTVMYTQCPEAGTTCDDGNPDTENDIENGECCCMGCPYPKGTSCDDGNPNTQNDMYDEYCNCVGIPMDSIHIRIAASEDDVEESGRNGTISAYDDKITIVSYPRKGNQVIGLRFTNINIAPDSKISTAYLRFVAENDNNRAGSLMIYAEDVNNSMPFDRTERRNVSSRNKTSNVKTWTPPDWTGGQTYETKNIAPIIQELIDRDDWEGNDAAITIIIEGTGRRVAKSFDDSPQNAPLLHIKYTSGTEGDDEDIE